jgi:hypothetical protein
MVSKWWTRRIERSGGERGINGKFTANQTDGAFGKFSAI